MQACYASLLQHGGIYVSCAAMFGMQLQNFEQCRP